MITSLQIPGGWAERELVIGKRALQLTVPANPDHFLDHLETLAASQGHADPYWARLWPSALLMAEWVVSQSWPAGTRALELGCGIGIVGMAGLVAGLDLTFSDYIPAAVGLAVANAQRNGFPTSRGVVLDWRSPSSETFPVILAADVLYELELHSPLLDVLDQTLAVDGRAWIGDPGRYHCEAFVNQARQRGYKVLLSDAVGRPLTKPLAGEFVLLHIDGGPSGFGGALRKAVEDPSRADNSAISGQ